MERLLTGEGVEGGGGGQTTVWERLCWSDQSSR